MSNPVKVLVVDPTRGYQREIEAGETAVDGDGNALLYPGYGPPVDDIAGLKAVVASRRADQQARLVEDADPNTVGVDYPSEYAWDSSATEADDPGSAGRPPAIVLPDDAPVTGRWVRIYSEVNGHFEIHEIGGRDELTIENLATDELASPSSSSSPGPGEAIKVLVPDGGGGVMWIDLTTTIEDSVTDEMDTVQVLQPDGAGGVQWNDPDIAGFTTTEVDAVKVLQPDGAGGVQWNDPDIEGFTTSELDGHSSSSSPGPGEAIKVLVPDGGGGVVWIELSTTIEDSVTDEMDTVQVLQPDGAGGVQWNDPDIEGFTTTQTNANYILQPDGIGGLQWTAFDPVIEGDLDMNCNDITYVNAIYFCDQGTGSSSGSSGLSDLWIRPDLATGEQLEYHAEGGHRFESPVAFTGTVSLNDNNILMGAGGVGNDNPVLTFAAGATPISSFSGALTIGGNLELAGYHITGTGVAVGNFELRQLSTMAAATITSAQWLYLGAMNQGVATTDSVVLANVYVPTTGAVGMSAKGRFVFTDATPDTITVTDANLYLGANALGNSGAVLTFAAGATGTAAFTGGITVGDGTTIGLAEDVALWFFSGYVILDSGNLRLQSNGIGNDNPVLTFAAGADGAAAFTGDIDATGHVQTDDAFYIGDPDTNGSWRITRDDWDLIFEQRDMGSWNVCDIMPGCASSSSA